MSACFVSQTVGRIQTLTARTEAHDDAPGGVLQVALTGITIGFVLHRGRPERARRGYFRTQWNGPPWCAAAWLSLHSPSRPRRCVSANALADQVLFRTFSMRESHCFLMRRAYRRRVYRCLVPKLTLSWVSTSPATTVPPYHMSPAAACPVTTAVVGNGVTSLGSPDLASHRLIAARPCLPLLLDCTLPYAAARADGAA
jgi:hypothetical protein